MNKHAPIGWDAPVRERVLQLGTCYSFSGIPTWMPNEADMPLHGYAIVYAFHHQPPPRISLQWLPYPDCPIKQLPLQPLLNGIDQGQIQITAVLALSIADANRQVRQRLKITDEHIDLIGDNPETADGLEAVLSLSDLH